MWRQALPAGPSLGEYPEASEVRPALFTRFVPVAGQDGQLPPIETTSVSETPLTPLGRADQALKRLVFGPPLDATAIAVERMRKLVALPRAAGGRDVLGRLRAQAMLAALVLAGLPGLSYSLPAGAAIASLMLAAGISCRQTTLRCRTDSGLRRNFRPAGIPGAAPQGGVSGSGCAFVGLLRCDGLAAKPIRDDHRRSRDG